jgi:hypothetical protein
MPIIRGAASEYTQYVKSAAQISGSSKLAGKSSVPVAIPAAVSSVAVASKVTLTVAAKTAVSAAISTKGNSKVAVGVARKVFSD